MTDQNGDVLVFVATCDELHEELNNFPIDNWFADVLSEFKQNFSEILVPNLKRWEEKKIRQDVHSIFLNFSEFYPNPTKERLITINKMILNRLSKVTIKKKTKYNKISRFYHHHIGKHLIWTALITVFSGLLYFIRVSHFGAVPDEAFTFSVTIGVMLLVGYFAIPYMKQKRAE